MNHCTSAQLIAFEAKVVARFAAGELPFLVHLSGGNEEQLIEIFRDVKPEDWVLASHRNHYHYLLKGGSPERLEQEIRDGRSMFVYDRSINFLCSAVLAGTCGIGAGLALAFKRSGSKARCWVFLGDGAEEQGSYYEAALFVEAHDLPCTFVIEDNQRQVDTDKATRRGVNMRYSHAWRPLDHFHCVRRYYYAPTFPHGGCGLPPGSVKFQPEIVAKFANRRTDLHPGNYDGL